MPDPFQIRNATEADIPAITAIYAREVETGIATFEETPPTPAEMAGRLAKIVAQGLPYIVAARDDRVLGYAYAGIFHPRAAYRYTLEDTVYIDPAAHRQGIGRALLANLIDRCEALGCRQMIALISSVPDSASLALHSAMGFRTIGIAEAVGFKFGRWIDIAYMQRPIGAGRTVTPDRPLLGPIPLGQNYA